MHCAAMCLTAVKWEQRVVRRIDGEEEEELGLQGRVNRRDYMIFRISRPYRNKLMFCWEGRRKGWRKKGWERWG